MIDWRNLKRFDNGVEIQANIQAGESWLTDSGY
jgi:hypothetical protein